MNRALGEIWDLLKAKASDGDVSQIVAGAVRESRKEADEAKQLLTELTDDVMEDREEQLQSDIADCWQRIMKLRNDLGVFEKLEQTLNADSGQSG
jgi:DNA-binding transcriptional regulator GbsR (MarR family)